MPYKDPEKQREFQRLRHQRLKKERKETLEQLKAGGCVRCGELDPVCLDFHHTGDKGFTIGATSGKSQKSHSEVIREAKKCVVLCSNCHRKLHAGRFVL